MSKFVQFVDGEIEFRLQIFDPDPQSVARMPQNFCFSGLVLANQATQYSRPDQFATQNALSGSANSSPIRYAI